MYPERIVLQEEVEAWSALVKPILSNRIDVELRAERDAPAVLVDRAGLELAILNLALNAVDAMPSGGKLRITVRRGTAEESRELGGECSVVEVADTGSGMTPEVLERIFDPFFTTKPVGKGTGLGLSQVYGFCEQAGCIVRAQSAPGEGTTLRMYLRVAPAAVSGTTERTPASAPLPRSVLLVDDNVEVAQGMAAVLRQSGCEVQYAQSAEAALAILESRARDFDVLLSDIVMPDTSGIDLALRVRSRWPKLSIVLMTGHAMGDTEPPSGMPVLRKPFELQELAAAVAANSRADESAMRYYG
jgi:CheY-like chemotaxis protein